MADTNRTAVVAITGLVAAGAVVGGVVLLGGEDEATRADVGDSTAGAPARSDAGPEQVYRMADFKRFALPATRAGQPALRTLSGVRGGLVCGVPQGREVEGAREVVLDDGEVIALLGAAPPAADEDGRPLRRCYQLDDLATAHRRPEGVYVVRREGSTP